VNALTCEGGAFAERKRIAWSGRALDDEKDSPRVFAPGLGTWVSQWGEGLAGVPKEEM